MELPPFKRRKLVSVVSGRNGDGGGSGSDGGDDNGASVRKSANVVAASGVAQVIDTDAAVLQLRSRLLHVLRTPRDRCAWTLLPDLPDEPGNSENKVPVGATDDRMSTSASTSSSIQPTTTTLALKGDTLPPSDASELPPSNNSVNISHCPMCQMKFAEGLTRFEVDNHIALCLQDITVDW